MATSVKIQQILDQIKQTTMSPSSMETLCEFERVLDENGLYAFLNWKEGELVEGPIITAYRVACTFSWPLEKMPDPAGAQRLIPYGAKVYYKKAWLVYPIKIKSETDFRPTIKKAKLARVKIWLITINLPKYLIKEIKQSSKEIMDQEMSSSDIETNYSQAIDNNQPAETSVPTPTQNMPVGF